MSAIPAGSRVGYAIYPVAARLLRLYLTTVPVRLGKPQLLELWWRHMNWRRADTFVASSLEGIRFHLNMRDSVAAHIFLTGMWESGITALMSALLKPGDTFVDVGANIGWHTLLASKLVGPAGKVIAIEPAPWIRDTLAANIALNPQLAAQDNVVVLPFCVSDRDGIVKLSALEGGNSGETTMRAVSGNVETVQVEARTLDALLSDADLSRCPLIKMDIEGAEYLAASGMPDTLERFPGISLVLEVNDAFLREMGHSAQMLFDWFGARGYRGFNIDSARVDLTGAGLALRPLTAAPSFETNVLFTRDAGRFLDRAWGR